MKVLVATKDSQGWRKNDFNFVPDGELVMFGMECDRDKGNPDGGCGCSRALVGVVCGTATTTFTVAETDISKDEYIKIIVGAWEKGGWPTDPEFVKGYKKDAEILLAAADYFDTNTILEYRYGDITKRNVFATNSARRKLMITPEIEELLKTRIVIPIY